MLELTHDGLTLSAEIRGPVEGPLVILIHGFPDTPHSWDAVADRLVAAGYRVLMPWLRGYTQGSACKSAAYDLLSVAGDMNAWLRHLEVKQAHLVGHDWGALTAMVLAGTSTHNWRSLSLLAIPPFPTWSGMRSLLPVLPQQLRLSSYMPVMQSSRSYQLVTKNNAAYVEDIWRKWSPGWDFSEAEFAPTRAVFTDEGLAWASTRYYRNFFTLHRRATRQMFSITTGSALNLPTLALAGERDGCMHIRTHKALSGWFMRQQTGRFDAQYLADCGHFLQAERPEPVAEALLAHFAKVEDKAHQPTG